MLEVAATLPREWIETGAAIGSAEQCCDTLQAFLDTGVDEVVFHGSTPAQNEGLVRAWRARN